MTQRLETIQKCNGENKSQRQRMLLGEDMSGDFNSDSCESLNSLGDLVNGKVKISLPKLIHFNLKYTTSIRNLRIRSVNCTSTKS